MVCLLSTLYNWGVGSVGAAHPWRMVYHTLPICTPVWMCDRVEMTWTGMPCTDVHARGLLLAPAVATAGQQTRLSAQGWATLMAGPFWGHDDCSQSCRSSGNWLCGQIGMPSQSRGRLHAVLQLPLLPQQGNEVSTPTHRH